MGDEIKGFGPLRTRVWVDARADDAVFGGAVFDQFVRIDGAYSGDGFDHGFGEGRAAVRILFVKIKAVGFPVFVQQEAQIEIRLAVEPGDVGFDFVGEGVEVFAVQINAAPILPRVRGEAEWVQARAKPEVEIFGPLVLLEQAQGGQRAGGFVAVDAGGDVNARSEVGGRRSERRTGQGEEF